MQTPPVAPLTLRDYVLGSLTLLLGSGVAYLTLLLNRKKNNAETDHIRADTAKALAETRRVEIETAKDAGDIVLGLIKEVAAATVRAERLAAQESHWERKAGEWEKRALESEDRYEKLHIEVEILRLQTDKKIRVNPEIPPLVPVRDADDS